MKRSPRILAALFAAALAAPSFAADVLVRNPQDNGVVERFVDQADGTWARKVVNTPAGTGTTADQVQGNAASAATDSGNPVKVGGIVKTTVVSGSSGIGAFTSGQRADLPTNSRGFPIVAVGDGSGFMAAAGNPADALTGTAGLFVITQPSLFNGATWDRASKATTTSRIVSSAATTNATSAKASAGTVHVIEAFNTSATVKYLKLYNKASAPTVGTDTPVRTIALKATDKTVITFPAGYYFATGIAYALTGAAADADTTALAAGDVTGVNIDYN